MKLSELTEKKEDRHPYKIIRTYGEKKKIVILAALKFLRKLILQRGSIAELSRRDPDYLVVR